MRLVASIYIQVGWQPIGPPPGYIYNRTHRLAGGPMGRPRDTYTVRAHGFEASKVSFLGAGKAVHASDACRLSLQWCLRCFGCNKSKSADRALAQLLFLKPCPMMQQLPLQLFLCHLALCGCRDQTNCHNYALHFWFTAYRRRQYKPTYA